MPSTTGWTHSDGEAAMSPLPDLAGLSLAEVARLAEANRLPPVVRWHPEHCGDSGMRIARDGSWWHDGAPIARAEMVRLFSTILRREDDRSHVLVTPVEKLTITVDDAAFVAGEMKREGSGREARIGFRLNTGEFVIAGPAHPIRVAATPDGPRPYLGARGGMEALIARAVFYELVEIALAESAPAGVWSDGAFFALTADEATA
jgi:hypothetical protein